MVAQSWFRIKAMHDDARLDPAELDLVVLAQLAGHALALETQSRIAATGGHEALPARYGFVFQHLIPGALPISALAERLGVTQQAASKTVAEMEAAGYLTREADPADGRVRRVALSAQGRKAVDDARTARRALADAVTARLGTRTTATLHRALLEILELSGQAEAVAQRRVPPLR
jgi:DNA-binding MarR family transcriptional regulator